jgi:hypothetical protein
MGMAFGWRGGVALSSAQQGLHAPHGASMDAAGTACLQARRAERGAVQPRPAARKQPMFHDPGRPAP